MATEGQRRKHEKLENINGENSCMDYLAINWRGWLVGWLVRFMAYQPL